MRAKASVLRAAFSVTASNASHAVATATLRRVEENSSASILIHNATRRFTERVNLNVPIDTASGQRRSTARKPALDPFNHDHQRRVINKLFKAGPNDLVRTVQPIKVQMCQRHASTRVLVHQRKSG